MVAGRVGKKICGGNGMGGPDELTRFEVPPHIRVVEARENRKNTQNNKKAGQNNRKGKDSSKTPNACGTRRTLRNRGCGAHAVPSSLLSGSARGLCSASR